MRVWCPTAGPHRAQRLAEQGHRCLLRPRPPGRRVPSSAPGLPCSWPCCCARWRGVVTAEESRLTRPEGGQGVPRPRLAAGPGAARPSPSTPSPPPLPQAHKLGPSTRGDPRASRSYPHTYGNAVASASGQVNVVWVRRHTAVPPGDVGSHILTDALDTLAGTVRPCRTKHNSDQRQDVRLQGWWYLYMQFPGGGVSVGPDSHHSRLWDCDQQLSHSSGLPPPPLIHASAHPPIHASAHLPTQPFTHPSIPPFTHPPSHPPRTY